MTNDIVCSFCRDTKSDHPKKVFICPGKELDKVICSDCVKEIRSQIQSDIKKTGAVT